MNGFKQFFEVSYALSSYEITPQDAFSIMGYKSGDVPTEDDLKRKFNYLAIKYHPDKNSNDPKAAEEMKKVYDARDIIKNYFLGQQVKTTAKTAYKNYYQRIIDCYELNKQAITRRDNHKLMMDALSLTDHTVKLREAYYEWIKEEPKTKEHSKATELFRSIDRCIEIMADLTENWHSPAFSGIVKSVVKQEMKKYYESIMNVQQLTVEINA